MSEFTHFMVCSRNGWAVRPTVDEAVKALGLRYEDTCIVVPCSADTRVEAGGNIVGPTGEHVYGSIGWPSNKFVPNNA